MFGPGFGCLAPALAAADVAPQDLDLIIAPHATPTISAGCSAVVRPASPMTNWRFPLSIMDSGAIRA